MQEETNSQNSSRSSRDPLLEKEDDESLLDDESSPQEPFDLKATIQRVQSSSSPLTSATSRNRQQIGTIHRSGRQMVQTRTAGRQEQVTGDTTNPFELTQQKPQKAPFYKRLYNRFRYGRSYGPNDTIRKLPPKSRRYWAWKYEVLRPWEPQPPKNYYKLVHSENPWFDQPPTQLRVFTILVLMLLYSCTCAFIPWLVNINVLSHRLTVLKQPSWILPWWFNIFAASFTHINNAIGIWFIYLTGGFRKHLKKMIPWFLMLACQALWPDMLFSWRSIILAAATCSIGWVLSALTILLFTWKMGYAGFVIIFYNVWVAYQCVVLYTLIYLNGTSYTM